ncbi:metal ABC transporter solute-binding protein, Zn/Mn family [Vibrio sp. WXL210]|uniref:metal ABC transporter solute-binding protein, Zn/Mn family n=1 Tax=Vibrio sp. WXL210 TaxID=3450709 RepID=UPI003EC77AF0
MNKYLLILLAWLPTLANAEEATNSEQKPAEVLTTLPATFMIADQLTQGTGLKVENIAPARFGFERLPGWFEQQGAEHVEQLTREAQVVVSLGSIWQADPIFPHARAHNIHIVNVDAGQALLPNGQAVTALHTADGVSPFVWLSAANLMRMTEIVGDDFVRIWPEHAEKIHDNQGELLQSLKQLSSTQQRQLFESDIDSVILLDEALEDFVLANDLFVLERKFKANLDWNEQDIAEIAHWAEEEPELWVLTTRPVNQRLLDLLPEGISVLRIDPLDRWGRGIRADNPLQRWNLDL